MSHHASMLRLSFRLVPAALAALSGCAHIDRQGTFDGLVKDRIGFDYAADLPESLPVDAQTHWLRARTCTGPDDPGPRAVALVKSEGRIPRVFWLPCRDDGETIEAFARARGLEFKAKDERDATRPGAVASIREQTLSYPGHPSGESVAVFAVGEGDETIVIAGAYFDLAPEEMPAINALYAMGRALYPEPARRDEVRAQWRADARRRGREAWLRRHREGAMAAFAQGYFATAMAHLMAEREMWTRSQNPDARPWPPGATLPASFGLDTPLATAIAIVAGRLEAQGYVMRVATRLDDRLGEALSKQLRARLPWVTFVPSAAPQGPNVLVVDVDWSGVRVDAYTRQYERPVSQSTYTLEPTTETGSEVWGDATWRYTLRAGRGTPAAEQGTVEFARTLADTSPTFVERTVLVPTLFEKIWDDHLCKALDTAFLRTCFDRPQRVLTPPEWTESELQSGKLCGLNPNETAWQALDLEPPEAFRPTDEERVAWEAAESGAAQIAR